MHFNIDIEERGQVPNASQLDPAQTQTDSQTEGGEGRNGGGGSLQSAGLLLP